MKIAKIETANLKNIVLTDDDRKFYYNLDGIHLVFEDDRLVGWYCPDGPFEEA